MPHIHEKIDFAADVFIVYNNKVLIRLHEKYNKWLSVGGHIELDETPVDAALREVKEEVGLDVTLIPPREIPSYEGEYQELIPPWYMNIHPINENHKHISLIYFATSTTDAVIPERETDQWRWFSKEELDAGDHGISESILFYAKEALRVVQ